jgi:hypothetical protein
VGKCQFIRDSREVSYIPLVRQYPDAQGARLIIRLDTVETPPTEMSIFFDVVQREWLSPAGIGFELGKFIID